MRSFLPSAGGNHLCGKVRAEHVSMLQPFCCRAETLLAFMARAGGSGGWAKGLRKESGKELPATSTIRARDPCPALGRVLTCETLGNPISAALVLGSVTCRGRSGVSVAACSSRVSRYWLSWKEKLSKGTARDFREAAPILQAGGSISEILAQICEFSFTRKILGFLHYSPLPL